MSAPFDSSVDLLRALLWRDSGADKLQAYIQKKTELANARMDQFWSDWVHDVLNIDTANDFGLAVWARVLDVKLQVVIGADQVTTVPFGFGPHGFNLNRGNFSAQVGSTITLTTEQRRIVIKLRLYQLTGRASVFEVNEYLAQVFGADSVYAIDELDMTFIAYIFRREPSQQIRFILNNFDILPRPAAVGSRWVVEPRPSFRFGPYSLNFNRGNFGA